MDADPESQALCDEIAGEVRDIALSLFMGRLKPAIFEQAVKTLEMAKMRRHGYQLTSERLVDGNLRFHVFNLRSEHECATLDFNSATKSLEIHQTCG